MGYAFIMSGSVLCENDQYPLAAQFIISYERVFLYGFLLGISYVIYQLFRFVSPALYENEKKYSTRIVGGAIFFL